MQTKLRKKPANIIPSIGSLTLCLPPFWWGILMDYLRHVHRLCPLEYVEDSAEE